MLERAPSIVPVIAVVCLTACGSEGGGTASSGAPASSAPARSSASAAAKPAGKPAPELAEVKNDKRKLSFKAPKDLKADPSGDSYSWDTMQIMVEQTLEPVAKSEDLMKVAPPTTTEGATVDNAADGEILIASWKQKDGPAHAICGQKDKSVALRFMFEPDHKDVAMGMCKTLKVE